MPITDSIQQLSRSNQLQQIEFLEFVANVLKQSQAVSHILVRGSIARGRADRFSDVDLVIGIASDDLTGFLTVLDAVVSTATGSLFPGWYDSLAPDMGGWGFVYLVPFRGLLYELDLYVVPEGTIPAVISLGALKIYANAATNHTGNDSRTTEAYIDVNKILTIKPTFNIVIEVFALLQMMSKRVARRQRFLVYGLSYLVNDAMQRLIRHCFIPNSKHWGWYYLEDELGMDPRGHKCLQELSALISIPLDSDQTYIKQAFATIAQIISIADPVLWLDIAPQVEAYKYYMKIK